MKTATIREIRMELKNKSEEELVELCLGLCRFKKDNKELLTYQLFESGDEFSFVQGVKAEMTEQFQEINTSGYYLIKKSVRKILRGTKKYIRYSKVKETEVELLMHFCEEMLQVRPSIKRNTTLMNLFERQLTLMDKAINTLHEDLQYDYRMMSESLRNHNE